MLHELRLNAGLTVDNVAKALLCFPTTISQIETGQSDTVSLVDVRYLCWIYEVDSAERKVVMTLARAGRERDGRQRDGRQWDWRQEYEFSTSIQITIAKFIDAMVDAFVDAIVDAIAEFVDDAAAASVERALLLIIVDDAGPGSDIGRPTVAFRPASQVDVPLRSVFTYPAIPDPTSRSHRISSWRGLKSGDLNPQVPFELAACGEVLAA